MSFNFNGELTVAISGCSCKLLHTYVYSTYNYSTRTCVVISVGSWNYYTELTTEIATHIYRAHVKLSHVYIYSMPFSARNWNRCTYILISRDCYTYVYIYFSHVKLPHICIHVACYSLMATKPCVFDGPSYRSQANYTYIHMARLPHVYMHRSLEIATHVYICIYIARADF